MKRIRLINLTKWVYKIKFCESWVLALIIWNLVLSAFVFCLVKEDFTQALNSEPPAIEEIIFEPIEIE